MILVDANILLYAEDALSPLNAKAVSWWDSRLSGKEPVCLCWTVINAFIRIGTNPRVFKRPLTITEATERVHGWLDQPCVRIASPTVNHWRIYREMLCTGKARGNLVTDAHLAALAIAYGCELCSTDADFARFPGLKWRNPLTE
jgi:toxin-antitoxin system PIN domain toxin